jgi:hypothetical protein
LRALLRLFGPYYTFLGLFTFLEECVFRIFQPLFMGKKHIICIVYQSPRYKVVSSSLTTTIFVVFVHVAGIEIMNLEKGI